MGLHQTSGRWQLGLSLVLSTVFLWGVLPIALIVSLQALDVYTVTWFRFLIAFGLLALFLAKRQQLPAAQKLRTTSPILLVAATLGLGLNYLFFLQGLAQTSPTNAQVILQLAPILLGFGAIAIFRERYTITQWLGLGVLTLGLALFFHEQLQLLIAALTQYLVGTGILVLASITWVMYALAQKQLLQKLSAANIMLIVYGGCALLFAPLAKPQQILALNPLQFSALLFCGLNTLVAYGAFAEALEHWEASRVSAVLSLSPIVTLISVWVASSLFPNSIHAEHFTALGLVGAALVVSGSMTAALGKRS
jgi:drug/metabolite transporter (DMT)-like permease